MEKILWRGGVEKSQEILFMLLGVRKCWGGGPAKMCYKNKIWDGKGDTNRNLLGVQ